jgi:hypothetical protein
MNGPAPPARKPGRFWLTLGEVTAVLAVAIAGLSYWETHREHGKAAAQAAAEARARAALVLEGAADAGGRRVVLKAVRPGQVVQSQRYLFPAAVLDHAMEVVAATPQIDLAWIEAGLERALDRAHAKGAGEARLPVAIVTTYVEDGETRSDRSLYVVGYAWRSKLILGRQVRLQGIALERRGVAGDLKALVDRRFATQTSGSAPT